MEAFMADYVARDNEKLMNAIHRLKASTNGDPVAAAIMQDELMHRAKFYVPVKVIGDNPNNRKLCLGVVTDKEKQHFYMLFSDRDKLRAFYAGKRVETVTWNFDEVAQYAIGDAQISGFVLNPKTDDMIIARQMIKDIHAKMHGEALGMDAVPTGTDEDVLFKDVRQDQTTADLLNALTGYFRRNRDVAEAYIRDMVRNGHTDYVVIIRHIGSMDETFSGAMAIAKPVLKGRSLALLSAHSPIAEKAIEGIRPFYRKGLRIVEE